MRRQTRKKRAKSLETDLKTLMRPEKEHNPMDKTTIKTNQKEKVSKTKTRKCRTEKARHLLRKMKTLMTRMMKRHRLQLSKMREMTTTTMRMTKMIKSPKR